jgi:hypothetical protein
LLNPLGDGITVNGAKRNHPHDEEIEGTLREIESVFSLHAYGFYIYIPEHVEGQGICINYFMESGAGRNRALTCMSGNCIERPLRPLRLQNATLERQNAEFIDNCCEQTLSRLDTSGEQAAKAVVHGLFQILFAT